MPDDKSRVKQGQTLNQTAQRVGDPRNMAKILGVAGEGLWDFLGKAQEYFVPQSVEELAMEGSPAGKVMSAVIGALPKSFVKPALERLYTMVDANKLFNPRMRTEIMETIERNTADAAHLDRIDAIPVMTQLQEPGLHGAYGGMNKELRANYDMQAKLDPAQYESMLADQLAQNKGLGLNARMYFQSGTPVLPATPRTLRMSVPQHEFVHLKDDILDPLAVSDGITDNVKYSKFDYEANPYEVVANVVGSAPIDGEAFDEALRQYLHNADTHVGFKSMAKSMGTLRTPTKLATMPAAVYRREFDTTLNDLLSRYGRKIEATPDPIGHRVNYNIKRIVLDR